MFVVVVHTNDGPGNSQVFGPYEDAKSAQSNVPVLLAMISEGDVFEVVEVTLPLIVSPDAPV